MTTKTATTTDVTLTREDEALVEKMKSRTEAKKGKRPVMPPLMAMF